MSVIGQVKSDLAAAKKIRLPWWVILSGIFCSVAMAYLFDQWGRFDLVLPTFNSIGMLGFVVALKRDLGREMWFWFVMIAIAAIHVPVVLFIPWTTTWVPALLIAVVDTVDVCAMLTVLAIAEIAWKNSRY
ncbi:MAG TPA: hypothetical protein VGT78_00325 [Rhizomicrobium sp.]|nr:hypothetical protein [Rhizomicrobium sp.]